MHAHTLGKSFVSLWWNVSLYSLRPACVWTADSFFITQRASCLAVERLRQIKLSQGRTFSILWEPCKSSEIEQKLLSTDSETWRLCSLRPQFSQRTLTGLFSQTQIWLSFTLHIRLIRNQTGRGKWQDIVLWVSNSIYPVPKTLSELLNMLNKSSLKRQTEKLVLLQQRLLKYFPGIDPPAPYHWLLSPCALLQACCWQAATTDFLERPC